MSRSRSRSRRLSRERSIRLRSRNHSRSHDRRLCRRSWSPVDRRAGSRRSRSRSRSPSSGSSREERLQKRHKKHSKKAKKEEKKRHKKHRKDKEQKQEVEDEESAAPTTSHSVVLKKEPEVKAQPVKTAPVDAKSFFKQLQKQEAAKGPVGTVHSRGLPAPVSATAISTSDKWECSKAGCGHMNSKHAPACNKCGAMKRITEWR